MTSQLERKVLSLNVGIPRAIPVLGGSIVTAIFKSPIEGRVALRRNNLDGDRQADLSVHGGPYKAVYLYPSEHYRYWAAELPEEELPYGCFGENLTSTGMDEETVRIGDQFRIGSAVLQVSQPRMPCFKLNLRFDRPDMVKRFWKSGLPGIYFSIVQEGEIGSGDSIEQVGDGPEKISVADVVRLYRGDESDMEKWKSAMRSPLFGGWKQEMQERRRDMVKKQ